MLLPLQGDNNALHYTQGAASFDLRSHFALPWAMSRLPLQGVAVQSLCPFFLSQDAVQSFCPFFLSQDAVQSFLRRSRLFLPRRAFLSFFLFYNSCFSRISGIRNPINHQNEKRPLRKPSTKYFCPLPVTYVVMRSIVPWFVAIRVTCVEKIPFSTHSCIGLVSRLNR